MSRAAKLFEAVGDSGERVVKINWSLFSLSQVNHPCDEADDARTKIVEIKRPVRPASA